MFPQEAIIYILTVLAVPRFLAAENGPRNVNVTEGQSYTFHCKADAKPEAAIVWFQDGIELHRKCWF